MSLSLVARLLGPGNGLSSGVYGVRIDDVNGDGQKEIWCGDAAGHLYLFQRLAGTFRCVFRSDDLAPYVGYHNNLFPIKNGAGKTVRLAAVSPGYVMLFSVKWWLL